MNLCYKCFTKKPDVESKRWEYSFINYSERKCDGCGKVSVYVRNIGEDTMVKVKESPGDWEPSEGDHERSDTLWKEIMALPYHRDD